MEIDKLPLEKVDFGEAFLYHGDLYMRIETSEVNIGTWDMAGVRLSDGHVNLFLYSTEIHKVYAKVSYRE